MKALYAEKGLVFVEPAPGSGALHHVGTQKLDPFAERTNVWYASTTTREKYVLDLIKKIYPRVGSEKRAFVLSRSARRATKARPKPNLYPCTMPRTKVWLEWLGRDQIGTEKFMTQGAVSSSVFRRTLQPDSADRSRGQRCRLHGCASH